MTIVVRQGRRVLYAGKNIIRAIDLANSINPNFIVRIGVEASDIVKHINKQCSH